MAKEVEATLNQYLTAGLIPHSTSSYSSPLVVIPKKSGSFPITVDYKKLNQISSLSQLPIPRVDQVLHSLGKGRCFSFFMWSPLSTRLSRSSLTSAEDGGIFLIRSCGLHTRSSPTPGVGLSGLEPRPESAVLSVLPFTSSDFRDFRAHGPRSRIDDLSTPLWRLVARSSLSSPPPIAVLAWGVHPPPTPLSRQFLSCPQGATRALQKPPLQRRWSPSAFPTRT